MGADSTRAADQQQSADSTTNLVRSERVSALDAISVPIAYGGRPQWAAQEAAIPSPGNDTAMPLINQAALAAGLSRTQHRLVLASMSAGLHTCATDLMTRWLPEQLACGRAGDGVLAEIVSVWEGLRAEMKTTMWDTAAAAAKGHKVPGAARTQMAVAPEWNEARRTRFPPTDALDTVLWAQDDLKLPLDNRLDDEAALDFAEDLAEYQAELARWANEQDKAAPGKPFLVLDRLIQRNAVALDQLKINIQVATGTFGFPDEGGSGRGSMGGQARAAGKALREAAAHLDLDPSATAALTAELALLRYRILRSVHLEVRDLRAQGLSTDDVHNRRMHEADSAVATLAERLVGDLLG